MGTTSLTLPVSVLSADKGINAKHEEWTNAARAYYHIDLLTRGGKDILKASADFLRKKPKENTEVYATRCEQMTYQNLMGTGIAWYVAAMFREEWAPTFRNDGTLVQQPDDFYAAWLKNVDRRGHSFSMFLSLIFEVQLKWRSAWVLTDLPRLDSSQFRSLAEQKAAGANNPYVVLYDPRFVINWDEDEIGQLNWVVIWSPTVRRSMQNGAQIVDRWNYYDRAGYKIYESIRKSGSTEPDATTAAVVSEGNHALAELGRVPVRRLDIPELFWLGNRAYPQAMDHLNQDNTFGWALKMANLPVPFIRGEYDETPSASETELMVLPAGSEFGWTEPKGTSFQYSAERISALREEIYRQMYLQAQGKDSSATASASSGYSKDMDFQAARDVLASFAKGLRESGESVLRDISDARGDLKLVATVSGTDFSEADVDSGLATLELMADADIPSDTLEKEIQIEVANKLLRDRSEEIRELAEKEIRAAPTKSQRAAQAQEATGMFSQALSKGINRAVVGDVVDDVKGG